MACHAVIVTFPGFSQGYAHCDESHGQHLTLCRLTT